MKLHPYPSFPLIICSLFCINALADTQATRFGAEKYIALAAKATASGGGSALTTLATGEATNQIEGWLNQFGTARINLGLDPHLRSKTSDLDMLLPLYNGSDDLFFTQYGIHRKDARTTANFGLGQRHFFHEWMVGVNAFYDYGFTGRNRRLGIGAEFWRNYYKLSVNGYTPLSGWTESRKLEGYDERPARGADIRFDGYLPAIPSIGGKVVYEKYYGDNVALFGLNKRQKNPYASTIGLNYTPIPIMTFGVDYRSGKSGVHDMQLQANVNYRLAIPLSKQFDNAEVSALRSLSGHRTDLVERNNSIVMAYHKQDEVTLQLPPLLQGKAGTDVLFSAVTTSRYPVAHIDWNNADYLTAGGKITQLDKLEHYRLTLPKNAGAWIIQGKAVNQRGRSSAPASIRIISTSNTPPTPSEPVLTNLHMVQEGSTVVDKGFGDLIYAAQIDAAHTGSMVSWSLAFNAVNFGEQTSIPVTLSGKSTSNALGEIQIKIPLSQLPDEDQLNYPTMISNLLLSVTPDSGKKVVTNEGAIEMQPIQGVGYDFKFDKNSLSLKTYENETVNVVITSSQVGHKPIQDMTPYINSNCNDCSVEFGKTDKNGSMLVTIFAGKTAGKYEMLFTPNGSDALGIRKIPLIIH